MPGAYAVYGPWEIEVYCLNGFVLRGKKGTLVYQLEVIQFLFHLGCSERRQLLGNNSFAIECSVPGHQAHTDLGAMCGAGCAECHRGLVRVINYANM